MSKFCVIDNGWEIHKYLTNEFRSAGPITGNQYELLEDLAALLDDAEEKAQDLTEEKDEAESQAERYEEKADELEEKIDELKDELANAKLIINQLELREHVTDDRWKFSDDPFLDWYRQNTWDEGRELGVVNP